MDKLSYLLVLLSLVSTNIFVANSYTLTASVLSQLGYNNQSGMIYINDNNIDNIDPNAFNGYTNLYNLDFSSEKLMSIDLGVFKDALKLNYLLLIVPSLNKITNSKNVKFPNLNEIKLYSNLTSLNKALFNAFPSLIRFDAGNNYFGSNAIKTVDVHTFESLSNLTEINLQLNSLTGFEYLQIPKNLRSLGLNSNKMNYFALSRTMDVLNYLDISANRFRSFKSMDFTFLANLIALYLSDNPHAYPNEISGHLKPLVNLKSVALSNLSISSIDSNYFKNNTKLEFISLSRNKISSLDNRAFISLNNLQSVSLDNNNLTKIGSGTFLNTYIQAVDLSYNQISQIENSTFYGGSYPYTGVDISLSSNKLTEILPRTFAGEFRDLDFSYNQISEIDSLTFDGISKIYRLMLSHNKVEKIGPGSFNTSIGTLDLSSNNLTELRNKSFVGQIKYLDLSNNRIETVEDGAFSNAIITSWLFLNNNNLTKISNMTFAGQNQLMKIYLNYNKLSTIESGAFNNLPNLYDVNLENNQLTQLDSSIFAGSNNIRNIYLKYNPNLSTTNLQSLCPSAATFCNVNY